MLFDLFWSAEGIAKRRTYLVLIICLFLTPLSAYTFGKNKVQTEKQEWSLIKTIHFDIYFPKGADEFGKTVSLMSEEAYYYLQDAFKAPILERVPIIFYESHREFQVTNIIHPLLTEGVGGFTESLRNRVVIPYDGSYKKLEETLIHELTHAYVNGIEDDLRASRFFNFPRMNLPFWLQEGLPEFLSIGGEDNYNNMFLMDMVFNNNLQPINQIGGYYAYRMGESILTYLEETYGREKVMSYFYSLKNSANIDSATKREFGMEFEELEQRWQNYLKRKYTSSFLDNSVPYEAYERLTDHKKDGSSMNYAPRFSPDGLTYLYFSNVGERMSIWSGDSFGVGEKKLVVRGETTGKYEQFHFQRSNLAWFPDNKRFAFVAKTKSGDVIYIADSKTGKVSQTIEMSDFEAVYEIDVSPDGTKITFSGQKEMKNNIYIMELRTREIKQITNTSYYDHQPVWSPDGTKITFVSEMSETTNKKYKHIFSSLTQQIYYYEFHANNVYQVTFDDYNNYAPVWTSDGGQILFISEEDKVSNFHIIDLTSNKRAAVTNTLAGVFTGTLHNDDSSLIFSAFYDNGWDIYQFNNPLDSLPYQEYQAPKIAYLNEDFWERFELDRYLVYGFDEKKKEEKNKSGKEGVERAEDGSYFRVRPTLSLDEKPTVGKEPFIENYKLRFSLDTLWGGMAYSSAYGAIGQLQLGFSDVMGDHTIGIQLGLSGNQFKDSDFVLSYLYLPHRIDYGFGVFRLTDEAVYSRYFKSKTYYIYERQIDTGGYALFRFPFDRFWRVDLGNTIYKTDFLAEVWNDDSEKWEKIFEEDGFVYAPQLSLTHDNILYGVTGPMSGWRSYLELSHSFVENQKDYTTLYGDVRNYHLFGKKYSFATKLVAGASVGQGTQYFRLDGFNGVRGLSESKKGRKKVVGTMELRFPFVDKLEMSFPLPMVLYQIRGSMYTDLGATWNNNHDFKGTKDGRLQDLVLGYGFGPRINLGFFILSFDTAWTTNLSKTTKPNYYISINEDF